MITHFYVEVLVANWIRRPTCNLSFWICVSSNLIDARFFFQFFFILLTILLLFTLFSVFLTDHILILKRLRKESDWKNFLHQVGFEPTHKIGKPKCLCKPKHCDYGVSLLLFIKYQLFLWAYSFLCNNLSNFGYLS